MDIPQISFLEKELGDLNLNGTTQVNPNTGISGISIPFPATPGRGGFTPQLGISYSAGSGNSIFGLGWNLSGTSAISISTKDGYPNYNQFDKYSYNGSQLVPVVVNEQLKIDTQGNYTIYYFRPEREQEFDRIERWVDDLNMTHWVVRKRDRSILVYGKSDNSRLADPNDSSRVFSWMLESHFDSNGNVIQYDYVQENEIGIDKAAINEINRFKSRNPFGQKYLKSIKYGNSNAIFFEETMSLDNIFHFEIVLDYGEHGDTAQTAYIQSIWNTRIDPFSSYGLGFEIRTWRLCNRILMFHHFPDESSIGENVLNGQLNLNYDKKKEGTILNSVSYTAFRMDEQEYTERSIPPQTFTYNEVSLGQHFISTSNVSLQNAPAGIGGGNYKLIDLYGEGIPGILFEDQKTWHYKRNLGEGEFGKLHQVLEKPAQQIGSYALTDFNGDGNLDIVMLQGNKAGFYEYDRETQQWLGFKTFIHAPSVENGSQLMDINGDGKPELVVFKQDRLTWYKSEGKEGFGEAIEIARSKDNGVHYIPALGENLNLDYFQADMTGDGSSDQVRILNGKVEYWSHLGHGHFTEGTLMGNAPVIEDGFEFDASRIRLFDLTGTGTSDLIYLGRGEIRYWINASGNSFLAEKIIKGLPYIENYASIQVGDFLGNGTPCLVWSSPLPHQSHSPIQYLPLTNGNPPGLLSKIENNMGMETTWKYVSSASHYLKDKREGRPWLTHLPSHSIVVEKQIINDLISNTKHTTEYRYHDGYFDGQEREFRGFGYVEQYDGSTLRDDSIDLEMPIAELACVRTWFHNGAYGWSAKRKSQYYLQGKGKYELGSHEIKNLDLLSMGAFNDAFRALAGLTIRTEVYGVSENGAVGDVPYNTNQNNFFIREVQPSQDRYRACFAAFSKEQLVCNFEKEAANPLVNHTLIAEIDPYGIPTKQLLIAYPNMLAVDTIHGKPNPQKKLHITFSESRLHHINEGNRYELDIPIETKTFEITDHPLPSDAVLFSLDHLKVEDILGSVVQVEKSIRTWERYYYSNVQSQVLSIGEVGAQTLIHHSEMMVGKLSLFDKVFSSKASAEQLLQEGKYIFDANNEYWWQPSDTIEYGPADDFYFPRRIINAHADQGTTTLVYDDYNLVLREIVDPLGLSTTSSIDYNLIAPHQITDINENVSEVIYDPLGMIRVSTSYGDIQLDASIGIKRYGNQPLSGYIKTDLEIMSLAEIVNNPAKFIQQISSFNQYNLFSWINEELPIQSISLFREQYIFNGKDTASSNSPIQTLINYSDGFGRSIQSLQKVEAGRAIKVENGSVVFAPNGNIEYEEISNRWLVSGQVVYNKKQELVRQYEPFFFPSHIFVELNQLQEFGETAEIEYDAVGRNIKTTYPNLTFSEINFKAWEIQEFDQNDTLDDILIGNLSTLTSDDDRIDALEKAKEHYNTPTIVHLDALGREVITEENGLAGEKRISVVHLDFYANPVLVIDPRSLEAFEYTYDKAGRLLYELSMDAGEKWHFQNVVELPIHYWDGRGTHQRINYDVYDRPVSIEISESNSPPRLAEKMDYHSNASLLNANGLVYHHYDQSGLEVYEIYDPSGASLSSYRQVTRDYKNEPDWTIANPATLLEAEKYTSVIEVDALGRTVQETLPDAVLREYIYHLSGEVNTIHITTQDIDIVRKEILSSSIYNAKGQKERLVFGNDVVTKYGYDEKTFRLKNLHSFISRSGATKSFQNLHYTYDPTGNITRIANKANIIGNQNLDIVNDYSYDAYYQLIQASGMTHDALNQHHYTRTEQNLRDYFKGTRRLTLNNLTQIKRYERRYTYDISGNRKEMSNSIFEGSQFVEKWKAGKQISRSSNRSLPALNLNNTPLTNLERHFDANGNCNYLPHVRSIQWNYRNNISSVEIIQRNNTNNIPDAEYYHYGSDGMRIRKVSERLVSGATGAIEIEEKIYLNGCEIKRKHRGNTFDLDRFTSHFSANDDTIATLYQWRIGATDGDKKIHFQLHNHLGSSSIQLNENAELISHEEYFPFGGSAFILGDNRKEINLKDYRYSGKERDDWTGLYYYGYRYYAPWIGNWLSPDPIGPEDGLNLYLFVGNIPTSFIDLDGLQKSSARTRQPTDEEIKAVGIQQAKIAIDQKFDSYQKSIDYIFQKTTVVDEMVNSDDFKNVLESMSNASGILKKIRDVLQDNGLCKLQAGLNFPLIRKMLEQTNKWKESTKESILNSVRELKSEEGASPESVEIIVPFLTGVLDQIATEITDISELALDLVEEKNICAAIDKLTTSLDAFKEILESKEAIYNFVNASLSITRKLIKEAVTESIGIDRVDFGFGLGKIVASIGLIFVGFGFAKASVKGLKFAAEVGKELIEKAGAAVLKIGRATKGKAGSTFVKLGKIIQRNPDPIAKDIGRFHRATHPDNQAPYDANKWREHLQQYGEVDSTTHVPPDHNMRRRSAVELDKEKHGSERSIGHNENGRPLFEDFSVATFNVPRSTASREMRQATRNLRQFIGKKELKRRIKAGLGYRFNDTYFTVKQLKAIRGGKAKIPGFTWEHGLGTKMMLLPEGIHKAAPHIGGRTMRKGR